VTGPDLGEIEAWFDGVLSGRVTRDEADRWATRWRTDDRIDLDEDQLWALDLLTGIDLPDWPGDGYLHSEEQIRDWRDEVRARRRRSSFSLELSNNASWETGDMPGPNRDPQAGADRRRRVDEIFGDVLPETTSDERDPERRSGLPDDWYRENRPPHHDR
jgi:hypothetical protein